MATASILGERCKALTSKSCEQKSLFAKERAIVSKKTSYSVVLALHVTRTTDALGKPYDMKLARCYRFPAGVTMAIQEGGLGHVDVMRWGGSNYRTAKGQQEKGQGKGQESAGWQWSANAQWDSSTWWEWGWGTANDSSWATWQGPDSVQAWWTRGDGEDGGRDGDGQDGGQGGKAKGSGKDP